MASFEVRLIHSVILGSLLLFGSVSHAQYDSKTTFIDILGDIEHFINYTESLVDMVEGNQRNVEDVLEQVRSIRLTVKYWTELYEMLTNFGSVAWISAAATPAFFLIKTLLVYSYGRLGGV